MNKIKSFFTNKKNHWVWIIPTPFIIWYVINEAIHAHNFVTHDTIGTFDKGIAVTPLFAGFIIACAVVTTLWFIQLYWRSMGRFIMDNDDDNISQFGKAFRDLQPYQKIVCVSFYFGLIFLSLIYLTAKLI